MRVLAMVLALAPAVWAQPPATSPSGFGRILFPGGGPAQSVQAPGVGRILYPGTAAPVSPVRGRGAFVPGQRPPVAAVLPFPVAFMAPGNAFDAPAAWGGANWAPTPGGSPPVVIVNQYFGRDAAPPAEAPRPSTAASVEPVIAPPASLLLRSIFLIAFKDHTIETASAYWVEGNTLRYVTTDGSENAVSLDLVDREMSTRINRERKVAFGLPD